MFTLTYSEWLDSHFRPVMGGESVDTTTDDTTSTDDTSTDDTSTDDTSTDDTASGGDNDDTSTDSDSDDDADLEEHERIKRERDEAREKLAAAEAAARKAKSEARRAREEAAKKGGNWEAVARERETELQEANEARATAEREKVEAQESLDSFRREVRVTRVATLLSFHDPQDALNALANKPETTADDKSCLRALRQLAKDKPYLVDVRKARGRALNGDGGGDGGLTWEQVQGMTEEQINANWDRVQVVLARGPGG